MSYALGRSDAKEGQIVRLFMRFYRNGVLVDPDSFGPIIISPENDPTIVLAMFSGPTRYEIGTYFVEWRVPSTDISSPYYNTLFTEIVNGQMERNFRDIWTNIVISAVQINQQGNFYVGVAPYNEEFNASNLLQFNFSLKNSIVPKGSKDYLVFQCGEVNSKLLPGVSGWPDGEIAIRKDKHILRNFAPAVHNSASNEYAIYIDTNGMLVSTYEAQLHFQIRADTVEDHARIIGIRSLATGYIPPSGTRQRMALDVDGQRADIWFESNATRGFVTGAGKNWGAQAQVQSAIALHDGITTLDNGVNQVATTFEVDGKQFTVTFSGTNLLINEVVNQINAISLLEIGHICAESFLDNTVSPAVTKIRIFSPTRATATYTGTGSNVKVVSVIQPVPLNFYAATGLTAGMSSTGSDFAQMVTAGTVNSHLRIGVSLTGSASDYQDVELPFGYWSPSQMVDFLNGQGSFTRAGIIATQAVANLALGTFNLNGKDLVLESNDMLGNISSATCTFTGTDPFSMNLVVAQLTAAYVALDVTIDTIPFGGNNYLRVRSNVIGPSSTVLIQSGTAISVLGFFIGQGSRGGDPILGATAVLLGDNRLQIVGDTAGSKSLLALDSVANGSTANSLFGFPTGGIGWGTVAGEDAGPARDVGRLGTSEPFFGIVASTTATIKSTTEPVTGWPIGGMNLKLQIDDKDFTVNFTENLTKAQIIGATAVSIVNFQDAHKYYYTNIGNPPLTSRKYGSFMNYVEVQRDGVTGPPNGYFEVLPGAVNATGVLIGNEYYPCGFKIDGSTITGIWATPGNVSFGATAIADLRAITFTPNALYPGWWMWGTRPSTARGFQPGCSVTTAAGTGTLTTDAINTGMNWFHAAVQVSGVAPHVALVTGTPLTDSGGGIATVDADYTAVGGTGWITLTNAGPPNLNISATLMVGMVPFGTIDSFIPICDEFTLNSVEQIDNRLVLQMNNGVYRTITFPLSGNPWSIANIVTTINNVLWSSGDQGHADSFGVNFMLESNIYGSSSQVGIAASNFGSGANLQFGINPNQNFFTLSLDPLFLPNFMVLELTLIGGLENVELLSAMIGGIITDATTGKTATLIDMFYMQSSGFASLMIVCNVITTPFGTVGDAINIGITHVADVNRVFSRAIPPVIPLATDPLTFGLRYSFGHTPIFCTGEVASYDVSTGIITAQRCWTMPAITPGGIVIDSGISPWWGPIIAVNQNTAEDFGGSTPLASVDVANQINTKALSSGVPFSPATVSPIKEIILTSNDYGIDSKVLIWNTATNAHQILCFYQDMKQLAAYDSDVSGLTTWVVPDNVYLLGRAGADQVATTQIRSGGSNLVVWNVTPPPIWTVADPWPMTLDLLNATDPISCFVSGSDWAYGAVGTDGNDIFRFKINGSNYEARVGTTTLTYAALGATVTAQVTGLSCGVDGSTPPNFEVNTISTGPSTTLQILGGSEGSTAAETFGWGSTRCHWIRPTGGLLTPGTILYNLADPDWAAYVTDDESVFVTGLGIIENGNLPSGITVTDYITGQIHTTGLPSMCVEPQWNFAMVSGVNPIIANVTFTPSNDSLCFVTSNVLGSIHQIRFTDGIHTTVYTPADLLNFLNMDRIGVTDTTGGWPGNWNLSTTVMLLDPPTGAAALIEAAEGVGTLRIKDDGMVLRRFYVNGLAGTFNVGERVRWTHLGSPCYGWVTRFLPSGAVWEMVVLTDPTGPIESPTFGDGLIFRVSAPANNATIGTTITDAGVRFMLSHNLEGWSKNGASEYKIAVYTAGTAPDCTFVKGEYEASYDSSGNLILEDRLYAGSAPDTKPYLGSIRVLDSFETSAWNLLGFDIEMADFGLYDRVGGSYISSSSTFGPPAKGTLATSPKITGNVPLVNSWIYSFTNSVLQLRFDGDTGNWTSCTLNALSVPAYLTLWQVIDMLNGRGTALGINATYPMVPIAGHDTLRILVDGDSVGTGQGDISVLFNVGTQYSLDDIVALINARFNAVLTVAPYLWPTNVLPVAYNWDGQLMIVSGRTDQSAGPGLQGSTIKICDDLNGSTINGWFGFPKKGIISAAVGVPMLAVSNILRGISYPSNWPASSGQLTIASLIVQSSTQDSAIEINSTSSGSTANSLLGFASAGAGPVFGTTGDMTYPLTGDGFSIVNMINAAFGGFAVADSSGNSLRLTSLGYGPNSWIEVLQETSWDIQMKFGLGPQKVFGSQLVTVDQLIASPWLTFQVI